MFKNKTLIIGFDGPDNVGKDTQIELLRKYFDKTVFSILDQNAPVGKTIKDKQDYAIEMLKIFENNINYSITSSTNMILNRTHYSEYAYGNVFREMGTNPIYLEKVLETDINIQDFLKAHKDVVLIIFTFIDTPDKIIKRDDGKSLYTTEQIELVEDLVTRFTEINTATVLSNIIIDINNLSIMDVHNLVVDTIETSIKFDINDIKIQ